MPHERQKLRRQRVVLCKIKLYFSKLYCLPPTPQSLGEKHDIMCTIKYLFRGQIDRLVIVKSCGSFRDKFLFLLWLDNGTNCFSFNSSRNFLRVVKLLLSTTQYIFRSSHTLPRTKRGPQSQKFIRLRILSIFFVFLNE